MFHNNVQCAGKVLTMFYYLEFNCSEDLIIVTDIFWLKLCYIYSILAKDCVKQNEIFE